MAAAGFSSLVSLLPSFPPLIVCPSDQPPSSTVGLSCCFNYICRGEQSYIVFLSLPACDKVLAGPLLTPVRVQCGKRGAEEGWCRGSSAMPFLQSGHIGTHPHMSGVALWWDDRRLSWKQWRALSALQCAQYALLFYPLAAQRN